MDKIKVLIDNNGFLWINRKGKLMKAKCVYRIGKYCDH